VRLRGANPLKVGQPVSAMGFTAMAMTLRIGEITALHAHESAQIIETDTAFNSGASGGGLFRRRGRTDRMLTFRMRGGTAGHYFAVPMQWIRDRLPRESQWAEIAPLEKAAHSGLVTSISCRFHRAASLEEQGRWSEFAQRGRILDRARSRQPRRIHGAWHCDAAPGGA